jgi:ubiquinone/menaquinone biosynthesis C-methylase UbiE
MMFTGSNVAQIFSISRPILKNRFKPKGVEMNNKSLVKEQFGANAAAYVTSKVHAKGASLARLVELVKPQSQWHALDIATAAGHTALTFAPHVTHVTASDITPEMLPLAEQLAQERGITNLTTKLADAEDLPFAEASFDLVTCRIAPHHFPNIGQFVAEAARVLRPGGILAVVDNIVPGSLASNAEADDLRQAGEYVNAFEKLRDPSHLRCLSLDEWVELFEQAGFTLLHQEIMSKEMDFESWAARWKETPDIYERLCSMLDQAPAAAADFLQPQTTDGKTTFRLAEAIVIGQLTE